MPLFRSPVPPPRHPFTGVAAIPVRPWIPCPDDDPPASADRWTQGPCDACRATGRVVFVAVLASVPDGWTQAETSVRELHLCGHHAGRWEDGLEALGWVAVADTRESSRETTCVDVARD